MKIALCFPGQGSQEIGMGRDFAESSAAAGEVFAVGSDVTGLDLARLCFEGPIDDLTDTRIQQPALVTASLACLAEVRALGIEPVAVVGHSVGEYAALAACGALSEGDAIWLVSRRGEVTAEAARSNQGVMAAILGLEDEVVEELCDGIEGVWAANYNCPGQVVVSGTEPAVSQLLESAVDRGARRTVRLRVTGAFHSPLVSSAADLLEPAIAEVTWKSPHTRFMSTVTARFEPAERLPVLLLEQLTAPVRFTQAVSALVSEGVELFVEVGPGQVLAGLVRRIDRSVNVLSVGDRPALARLEEVLGADT
jgi:[acyl-carrier-protein] S-malonyltransferase